MANYLYNGVELPEIPEVAGYQSLMIFEFDTGYALHAYKANKYISAPRYLRASPVHEESFNYPGTYKYFSLRDGSWVQTVSQTEENQQSVYSDRYKKPIWTNFTFEYTTISTQETLVLCEASEPVPVPVYDHTAMVQGWIVGKRLAAMRWRKLPDPDVPVVPEYDVVFEKGVLYIKKAPAVMVGSTLSFASADINGGGSIG